MVREHGEGSTIGLRLVVEPMPAPAPERAGKPRPPADPRMVLALGAISLGDRNNFDISARTGIPQSDIEAHLAAAMRHYSVGTLAGAVALSIEAEDMQLDEAPLGTEGAMPDRGLEFVGHVAAGRKLAEIGSEMGLGEQELATLIGTTSRHLIAPVHAPAIVRRAYKEGLLSRKPADARLAPQARPEPSTVEFRLAGTLRQELSKEQLALVVSHSLGRAGPTPTQQKRIRTEMLKHLNAANMAEAVAKLILMDQIPITLDAGTAPCTIRIEREAAALVAQGLQNQQIGERLFMEKTTVRDHLRRLCDRFGANNRQHLVRRLFETGVFVMVASVDIAAAEADV